MLIRGQLSLAVRRHVDEGDVLGGEVDVHVLADRFLSYITGDLSARGKEREGRGERERGEGEYTSG